MDDYRIRVAKVLEMARAESGLSQQKLADKMGIGRTSIFRYEQGTMTPDASTIIKWFVCCGVAAKPYIALVCILDYWKVWLAMLAPRERGMH